MPTPFPGMAPYLERRGLWEEVHTGLIAEIDLLRASDALPMRVAGSGNPGDYRIVVSRSWHRPRADVYPFGGRDRIPDVPIPLRRDENEPVLALHQIVHDLYDRASYDRAVDYSQPPVPPVQHHTHTTGERHEDS